MKKINSTSPSVESTITLIKNLRIDKWGPSQGAVTFPSFSHVACLSLSKHTHTPSHPPPTMYQVQGSLSRVTPDIQVEAKTLTKCTMMFAKPCLDVSKNLLSKSVNPPPRKKKAGKSIKQAKCKVVASSRADAGVQTSKDQDVIMRTIFSVVSVALPCIS